MKNSCSTCLDFFAPAASLILLCCPMCCPVQVRPPCPYCCFIFLHSSNSFPSIWLFLAILWRHRHIYVKTTQVFKMPHKYAWWAEMCAVSSTSQDQRSIFLSPKRPSLCSSWERVWEDPSHSVSWPCVMSRCHHPFGAPQLAVFGSVLKVLPFCLGLRLSHKEGWSFLSPYLFPTVTKTQVRHDVFFQGNLKLKCSDFPKRGY